jgi:signal transduction histidine kinase
MDLFQLPRSRSERLIALGRAALAALSLLAIALDPSQPAHHATLLNGLLVAYLAYALVALMLVWPADAQTARLGLITHIIDLPAFTAFMYFTQGPTSPFFVWFVFALLAAALRWQWQGVLWTALATITVYIALGLYADLVLHDPGFELNRFIIRSAYLALVAFLLGYLSAHEQRLRRIVTRLASWPRPLPEDAPLSVVLPHAASILGSGRLVLAWEEEEEPWRYEARLEGGAFTSAREPAAPEPPPPLAEADFLCTDLARPTPVVLHTTASGRLARWQGRPLPPELERRLGARSVLAIRLQGKEFSGRLFALDKPGLCADDLVLGAAVGRAIEADLDLFYLQQRREEAAVAGERVRLARELHDGVLQVLTGLALELQATRRLAASDPRAARARLAELQEVVASEQADLRFFVRQMKPVPLREAEIGPDLIAHLQALCRRIQRQWGLRVELASDGLDGRLSERVAHAAYRIVQEALVNAARHANAQAAAVRLDLGGGRLRLVIADDGHGFPFRGRHDLAALDAAGLGPASIRQRVAGLGGELVLDSGDSGARLEIALPLGPYTADRRPAAAAPAG